MGKKIELGQLIENFKTDHPTKELLFLYKAGSHFFDLAGPTSDLDYRGVYICPHQDSYNVSDKIHFVEYKTNEDGVKNSSEDVDFNLFSLSSFLKLLRNGDFNMMEMLYTPESKILYNTPLFKEIIEIRDFLMVRDISSFLGFIKKEYRRYGVNIFHFDIQNRFVEFLKTLDPNSRLKDNWSQIGLYAEQNSKDLRFTSTRVSNKQEAKEIPAIKIAGRLHLQTVKVAQVIEATEIIIQRYGHRQKSMAESGVEFKGLYHAMRNIYEANYLLDNGSLRFPFPDDQHEILKSIKYGTMSKDDIFTLIDVELAKLEIRGNIDIYDNTKIKDRIDRIIGNLKGRTTLWTVLNKLNNLDNCNKSKRRLDE